MWQVENKIAIVRRVRSLWLPIEFQEFVSNQVHPALGLGSSGLVSLSMSSSFFPAIWPAPDYSVERNSPDALTNPALQPFSRQSPSSLKWKHVRSSFEKSWKFHLKVTFGANLIGRCSGFSLWSNSFGSKGVHGNSWKNFCHLSWRLRTSQKRSEEVWSRTLCL